MITYKIDRANSLDGICEIPGDKSISHRAVILGSLAIGETRIAGLLESVDIVSTITALKEMGVSVEKSSPGTFEISGSGMDGLRAPRSIVNLGNSGTAMRLLCGLLAAQNFESTLTGDDSLRQRPMKRVTDPLRKMGASIKTSVNGCAPINIRPVGQLRGLEYEMPIASSQIKSAILLAGMYAVEETAIHESSKTRDHTERMLEGFGYPIDREGNTIKLEANGILRGTELAVPGDFSSAAFFIVGASIVSGSRLKLLNVGVNPTRTGLLKILEMMGAKIEIRNYRYVASEPVADLVVESSQLRGVDVPSSLVASMIDEFPVLSIAAANASGVTRISGAEELRLKESDRLATVVAGLRSVGIEAREFPDGMIIKGGVTAGGTVDSCADHRIAMAFSIAGLNAVSQVKILNCDNVATSFPSFVSVGRAIGMNIELQAESG